MPRNAWRPGFYVAQVVGLAALVLTNGWSAPAKVSNASPATSLAGPSVIESAQSGFADSEDEASVTTLEAAPAVRKPRTAPTVLTSRVKTTNAATNKSATTKVSGTEVIAYDGKLAPDWADLGWSPTRELNKGPAKIDVGNWMGWILARPGKPLSATSLSFKYRTAVPLGGILQVTLASETVEQTKEVQIANLAADKDGWYLAQIPIATMNPRGVAFDRIRIRPTRPMPSPTLVEFDHIVFTDDKAAVSKTPVLAPGSGKRAAMSIDCSGVRNKINPAIYGIAYNGASNQKDTPWTIGAPINRWGGNPTSRYNWQVPNAWNTANDYYFRNVSITETDNASETFLANNARYGMKSAVTLPMIGWVAKDTTSYSFPVSRFGRQESTDPSNVDIGNGKAGDGRKIEAGSPKTTSTESTPELVGQWVERLRGRVSMYFLDNEPELWDSTHRDVHPEPLTYDELLDKTIRYATVVRKADPEAVIAGPSSWGWPAYFWSAADAKAGFGSAPDRKAHGNLALIPWYLREVRAAEKRTGVKLLDVLDVHFYPAANNVYGGGAGGIDDATAALRIRQVRGLWDPTYNDESWVGEPIFLIPRLREWVKEYSPGLGISIGEWNFGGESDMSGAIATAEALGRFGTENLTSAYYWTNPPTNSPSFWAFRSYRNYDGKGAKFLDNSLSTTMTTNMSLFASTDDAKSQVTAIVLNTSGSAVMSPTISLQNCANAKTSETFLYTGNASGPQSQGVNGLKGNSIDVTLPPYSIAVVRIART